MYSQEGKDLTLSAAGDAIINREISSSAEEGIKKLVDLIRETDVGFVNLETILHDYEPYPNAHCGGLHLRSPEYVTDELERMGFNIFSAANNHIGDYSYGGMISTMEALEERNITYAGLGENLREARSASYLDTSAGNVALVACSSRIPGGFEAGEQRPDIHGRPGLSPLRIKPKFTVTEEWYNKIERLSKLMGMEEVKEKGFEELGFSVPQENDKSLAFLHPKGRNLSFVKGEELGITYDLEEDDKEEIKKEIESANKQSDWVLVSLHYHAGKNGHINDHTIPEFVESFAHECIESGADVFLGHGAHVMRAIEIYENKPIFYGLGNFFFQYALVDKLPGDFYKGQGLLEYIPEEIDLGHESTPSDVFDILEYDEEGNPRGFLSKKKFWETFLPVIKFENEELSKIDLYPVDLGMEKPRSKRGRPLLAQGEEAKDILKKLKELSDDYDTPIEIEGEKGIIDI